ncbi:MAG: rhodanese-like domain-containing protein [Candidatus Manganitrophus sp.]|nr:rhodanese-like domain-containing protein [Candidatus Manganitrophus sp.]WDT73347.1 MAG: rhodanese-like domain-containing protein [Candidatus Manganitrophus sp.]
MKIPKEPCHFERKGAGRDLSDFTPGTQKKKDRGEPFLLLDVREQVEFDFARIPDSVLIPLSQLPSRIGELDPEQEIVTVCHHGVRSLTALGILVKNGFTNVKNLTGGIDAYSVTADPSIPRYR